MLNVICLVGNVTRNPEVRYTPTGKAVCNLGLACNRQWKDKNGEEKKEVCFINGILWGKRAENCKNYLVKGSPVYIDGRLQSRSWEDVDGKKRSTIEILIENIQFLDRQKEGTSEEEQDFLPEEA